MRKYKEIHNAFCDYEVEKAKTARFVTVLNKEERGIKGIKKANVTKDVLIMQLAELV